MMLFVSGYGVRRSTRLWPVALSASMSVLTTLLSGPALAEPLDLPRVIRVSGQATVQAEPDRARLNVSVVTRAPTAREAGEKNAAASKAVLDKLRASVAQPGTVRTSGYDLSAEYDYSQNRAGGRGAALIGYVATNRLAVVTTDLPGLGVLVDEAVAAGASQIDSIGFFLADEASVRRRALEQAGQQARAEAEAVARGLDVGLGQVLDASTVAEAVPRPTVFHGRAMAMEAASAPPTEVVPGSLDIQASVTVTFAVR